MDQRDEEDILCKHYIVVKPIPDSTLSTCDMIIVRRNRVSEERIEMVPGTIYSAKRRELFLLSSTRRYRPTSAPNKPLPTLPQKEQLNASQQLTAELATELVTKHRNCLLKLKRQQFEALVPLLKDDRQCSAKKIKDNKWCEPLVPLVPALSPNLSDVEAFLVVDKIRLMPNPTLEKGMLLLIENNALFDAVTSVKLWEKAAGLEAHPYMWHIPKHLSAFLENCTDRVAVASSGQLLIADRVLKEEVVNVAVLEEGRPEAKGAVMGDERGLLWVQIDGETQARRVKVEDVFDVSAAPPWLQRKSDQFAAFHRGDAVQVIGSGVLGAFEGVLMIPGESEPSALVRLFVTDDHNDVFIPRHLRPFLHFLRFNRATVCSTELLTKCELFIVNSQFGIDGMEVPRGCLIAHNSNHETWTVDPLMAIGRFREIPAKMKSDTFQISAQQLQRLLPIPAQNRLASLEESRFQRTDNVGLQRNRSSIRTERKSSLRKKEENQVLPSWISRALCSDDETLGFKRGQLIEVQFPSRLVAFRFAFVKAILRPPNENSTFLLAESITPLGITTAMPPCLMPFTAHLPLEFNRTLICDLQNAKHGTAYLITKTHASGMASGVVLIHNSDGNLSGLETGTDLGVCSDLHGTFSVKEVPPRVLPFLLPVQPIAHRVAVLKCGHVERLLGSPLPLPNTLLWHHDRRKGAFGTVTRFDDDHAWIKVRDEEIRTTLDTIFRLADGLTFATNETSKQQFLPGDLVSAEGGRMFGRLRAIMRIPWKQRPMGVVILSTEGVAGDVTLYSISDLKFIDRAEVKTPASLPRHHDPSAVILSPPPGILMSATLPNVVPLNDNLLKEANIPKGAEGVQKLSGCKTLGPLRAAFDKDPASIEGRNGSDLHRNDPPMDTGGRKSFAEAPEDCTVAAAAAEAEAEAEALPEWQGNIAWIFSSERGIHGHPGSSAVDALLFSVFAFSHVLERKILQAKLQEAGARARSVLLDQIIYPLRRDNEAPCEGVEALIKLLDQVDPIRRQRKRDVLESSVVLFETLLDLEPFLHVGSKSDFKGSFFLQLTTPEEPNMITSSHCLEFSVLKNDLLFAKVPDVLMLVLPTNSSKVVVPSKMLDLHPYLQGSRALARCALCGASPVQVWDQQLFSRGGLRAALLCATCSEFLPKSRLRPLPPDEGPACAGGCSELLLTAIICRQEDDHHRAFVRARQGAASVWIHFNSMAYQEDDTFYGDVTQASVEVWLSRALATQNIDSAFCDEQKRSLHKLLFSGAHVLIYEREKS